MGMDMVNKDMVDMDFFPPVAEYSVNLTFLLDKWK